MNRSAATVASERMLMLGDLRLQLMLLRTSIIENTIKHKLELYNSTNLAGDNPSKSCSYFKNNKVIFRNSRDKCSQILHFNLMFCLFVLHATFNHRHSHQVALQKSGRRC